MAEGNRLPSLENAPHLKTDGEFFRISTLQRHHYITSSYTYQFSKNIILGSSLQYRSALVVTRMRIILFILLLIGLHLGRFPSELWQKSYDRHWPYVPKWNRRAMLYLLKPSSTSCLILLATSNCSSRTIIWIYISLPQASMQIGKSTTFISNNPWSL